MFASALIAGGRGRRLGGVVKALLTIDGQTIIDRQLALCRPRFDPIIVVANQPGAFCGLGVRVVSDDRPGRGPLEGVGTALRELAPAPVLVLAADMPYVTAPLLDLLIHNWRDGVDVVVPHDGHYVQPLCAMYGQRCTPAIDRYLGAGHRRAVDFIASAARDDLRVVIIGEAGIAAALGTTDVAAPFRSINRPHDLP